VVFDWIKELLPGALVTIEFSLIVAVITTVVSFVMALGLISRFRVVRGLCKIYVELFRAIPLLLFLIVFYFGLGVSGNSWFASAAFIGAAVLIVNESAYTADVYRGALLSIDKGQWQAGDSLGLKRSKTMRLIILPQFVRIALKPTVNMLVYTIKGSSLLSLITVAELTLKGKLLVASTFQPLEVYLLVGAMYLVITVPLGYLIYVLGDYLDARTGLGDHPGGVSKTKKRNRTRAVERTGVAS